jgi:hypothetical protein
VPWPFSVAQDPWFRIVGSPSLERRLGTLGPIAA